MVVRARQERGELRRQAILDAALRCFSEAGYEGTTIADIRRRSGASTGSLYHLFGSKEEIGSALYLEGIHAYQSGLLSALERHKQARQGLRAIVRFHLRWVSTHRAWARYLHSMRRAEFMGEVAVGTRLRELNAAFLARLGLWFQPHLGAGTLRELPVELCSALIIGPCQELARRLVAGRMRTSVSEASREIGDAVWRALAVDPNKET